VGGRLGSVTERSAAGAQPGEVRLTVRARTHRDLREAITVAFGADQDLLRMKLRAYGAAPLLTLTLHPPPATADA